MKTFDTILKELGGRREMTTTHTAGITRVQLCGQGVNMAGIECEGQLFVPDDATAYVEFYLSHAFPSYTNVSLNGEPPDRTAIHPATIARSYHSLKGKVVNLAHIMRQYDPTRNKQDRILGSVMAVEFPPMPACGWKVQVNPAAAPGIRAVAALHKAAEGVPMILDTWARGKTPFGDTEWTVSMENRSYIPDGGFLVKLGNAERGTGNAELRKFLPSTPEDIRALGWVYVPYMQAPGDLLDCMKDGGYIGIERDYMGLPTLFLIGGLDGQIFYYGVALTPVGKEGAARVRRIEASAAELVDVAPVFDAIGSFLDGVRKVVGG